MPQTVTVTVSSNVPRRGVGDLNAFKLRWIDLVHRNSPPTNSDFYAAYAMFQKYASGVDLDFDVSKEDIAATIGLSTRSVQKLIRRLEASGLMETTVRYGRSAVNTYSFIIPDNVENA